MKSLIIETELETPIIQAEVPETSPVLETIEKSEAPFGTFLMTSVFIIVSSFLSWWLGVSPQLTFMFFLAFGGAYIAFLLLREKLLPHSTIIWQLEAKNAELQQTIDVQIGITKELEAKALAFKAENAELQPLKTAFAEKVAENAKTLESQYLEQIKELKNANQTLKLESLNLKNKALENEKLLGEYQQTIQRQAQSIGEKDRSLGTLPVLNQRLTKENDTLKKQLETLTRDYQELQNATAVPSEDVTRISELELKNSDLEIQIQRLKHNAEKQVSEWADRISVFETQIGELEETLKKRSAQYSAMTGQFQRAKEKYEAAKTAYRQKTGEEFVFQKESEGE